MRGTAWIEARPNKGSTSGLAVTGATAISALVFTVRQFILLMSFEGKNPL